MLSRLKQVLLKLWQWLNEPPEKMHPLIEFTPPIVFKVAMILLAGAVIYGLLMKLF